MLLTLRERIQRLLRPPQLVQDVRECPPGLVVGRGQLHHALVGGLGGLQVARLQQALAVPQPHSSLEVESVESPK